MEVSKYHIVLPLREVGAALFLSLLKVIPTLYLVVNSDYGAPAREIRFRKRRD
jgi:hypothetical protein